MTLEFEGEEVTFDIPGWYVEGVASAKVFIWLPDGLVEERRGMFTVFR